MWQVCTDKITAFYHENCVSGGLKNITHRSAKSLYCTLLIPLLWKLDELHAKEAVGRPLSEEKTFLCTSQYICANQEPFPDWKFVSYWDLLINLEKTGQFLWRILYCIGIKYKINIKDNSNNKLLSLFISCVFIDAFQNYVASCKWQKIPKICKKR
jgi:hypothetical protein